MLEPNGPSVVLNPYDDAEEHWLGNKPGEMVKFFHVIGTEKTPSRYFEVGMYEIFPGERVPVHASEKGDEFAYVVKGSCLLLTENDTVVGEMQTGKVVYCPPRSMHGYWNHSSQPVELLVWSTKEVDLTYGNHG